MRLNRGAYRWELAYTGHSAIESFLVSLGSLGVSCVSEKRVVFALATELTTSVFSLTVVRRVISLR